VGSCEEVVEIICHHFSLMRYEFHIYRSSSKPFVVIFSERAARDIVFARGRVSDGPVDLRFHSWDADRFGERVVLPFHVMISLEGLPHHAWFHEIDSKVLGDEAVIHHADHATRRREDYRFYVCWAYCQNPSRIPQVVYLSLTDAPGDPRLAVNLQFTWPRSVKTQEGSGFQYAGAY
jgi:hypothetical protein